MLPILVSSTPAHYTFILKRSRPLTFYSAQQNQEEMPADWTWQSSSYFETQLQSRVCFIMPNIQWYNSFNWIIIDILSNIQPFECWKILENLTKIMDVSQPLTVNALATTYFTRLFVLNKYEFSELSFIPFIPWKQQIKTSYYKKYSFVTTWVAIKKLDI